VKTLLPVERLMGDECLNQRIHSIHGPEEKGIREVEHSRSLIQKAETAGERCFKQNQKKKKEKS
jgi:hypothetical protein